MPTATLPPAAATVRTFGALGPLAELSDAVVFVFALVTQLGDPWFLFVGLALLYWFGPERLGVSRRTGATVLALALGALALTVGLKSFFASPRPPGAGRIVPPTWLPASIAPAYASLATGDGFGFPSGHAVGTTVVYGGCATLLRGGARDRRWLAAGAVVVLVGLSRLVLGVHYPIDVVVGVLVGATFLAGVVPIVRRRPDRAFAVAAALSLLAVGIAAAGGHAMETKEAAAGFGGALGGLATCRAVEIRDGRLGAPLALVGLAFAGGVSLGTYVLAPPVPVAAGANALVVACVLALPALAARLEKSESGSAQNVSR
ncbi:phosphatase PAP2 family protein [Halegenticoccus soli]|uniref:phosphatase PAP2 family protein n=1 Tax=Halegenticoccus soli TaxID=1985678 RepID=UPI000C6CB20B|nr:phosphatase PAP2 family protein [Halegenticoccus soli]